MDERFEDQLIARIAALEAELAEAKAERESATVLPETAQEYWKDAIGGAYRPVVLGKHTAGRPASVRKAIAMGLQRAPECADVIAALVFNLTLNAERERFLVDAAEARATAAEAELAEARKALIETGRNLGAGLADNVSTAFLAHLPEEARIVRERATAAEARAEKMKEAMKKTRATFEVEYHKDGRVASVGHASDGLRKLVALLDAALGRPE